MVRTQSNYRSRSDWRNVAIQSLESRRLLSALTPAIAGDANSDGNVDVADLGILATNWQQPGGWEQGDFTGDNFVNVADLGLLATNWQSGVATSPAIAGDANSDGKVDVADLGILASNWQKPGDWAQGDFTGDNFVNVADLGLLATNWQSGVASSPAIAGDANSDGKVDVADLGILASNWQKPGTWDQGDFTGDHFVDVADLGLLATNWQAGVTSAPSGVTITPRIFGHAAQATTMKAPARELLVSL
jgi:hypothetical protein